MRTTARVRWFVGIGGGLFDDRVGGGGRLLQKKKVAKVVELVEAAGVNAYPATHFADGGVGAQDLAKGVLQALDEPSPYSFSFTYDDGTKIGRAHV